MTCPHHQWSPRHPSGLLVVFEKPHRSSFTFTYTHRGTVQGVAHPRPVLAPGPRMDGQTRDEAHSGGHQGNVQRDEAWVAVEALLVRGQDTQRGEGQGMRQWRGGTCPWAAYNPGRDLGQAWDMGRWCGHSLDTRR